MAYATATELGEYVAEGTTVPAEPEVDRLLQRASEVVDDAVSGSYDVDDTGTPTEQAVVEALRDATCAQVEMWLDMGETVDVETWPQGPSAVGYFQAGDVHVPAPPAVFARRAARALRKAGLLDAEAY